MIHRSFLGGATFILILGFLLGASWAVPYNAAQATAAPTESAATAAALSVGPGSFNLQPSDGLTDLSGYKATLRVEFKGSSPWTETLALVVQAKPSARALTATFKGKPPLAAIIPTWSAEVNGLFYRLDDDGTCIATAIPAQADPNVGLLVSEPADFLPGLIGAEGEGNKTVNGVAAKGYKFDERALGAAGEVKATGEVWVAATGGYVLKYSLTVQGGADYFGDGGDGTMTWAYDVTQSGQPAAIALPKDCPSGLVDAPVMDDAQNVQHLPGATVFTTQSTIAQVADFYQKQLPAAGWKLAGKPGLGDKGGSLNFTQGKSQLTIMITIDQSGTTVRLLLTT